MTVVRWRTRAAGLALGVALDAALSDPQRHHPVAYLGRAASALESRLWGDSRARGALFTAAVVGSVIGAGGCVERNARRHPALGLVTTAAATWTVLGGTSLAREGRTMTQLLAAGDLAGARGRLSHLCSRDATALGEDELARATVESLAENTSDAVVAPLVWGTVMGVPGLLGYRAANTLDAMVGYRNERYGRFGWASARLDDLLNVVPARLTAAVTVALAPLVGGSACAAARAWREDAPAHPSPNAGPVEATAAGALGVRLGGTSTYGGETEDRGVLGDGAEVTRADIGRAVTLTRGVGLAAAGLLVAACLGAAAVQGRKGAR